MQPIMSKVGRLPFRAWRRLTRKAGELGQSVVELAFVLPVLLLLLTGVIEVGNALNAYLTVVDVSRDSARLGSKGLASDGDIRNMAATEMSKLPETFDKNNDMTIDHTPVQTGDTSITVKVCLKHKLLLPALSTFFGSPITMCASTAMRTITFN